MKQRQATTAFNIFSDSGKKYGVVDAQLPEINMATADIKGAGIMGTLSVPQKGMFDSMRLTINWRSLEPSATILCAHTEHTLVLMSNVQSYDNVLGKYIDSSVKVICRGTPVKFGGGKIATGETMDVATEFELTSYQYLVDNIPQIKIDKINYIYEIFGEDLLLAVRANIGEL